MRADSGIYESAHPRVVLFVAADDDALFTYQALAKSGSYDAELARDGYEALLLAQLARPDAVVLDVRDRHIGGGGILRRLRAGVSTRALPVVVVGRLPSDGVDRSAAADRSGRVVEVNDPHDAWRAVRELLETAHRPEAAG